jgi:hypothetical protein
MSIPFPSVGNHPFSLYILGHAQAQAARDAKLAEAKSKREAREQGVRAKDDEAQAAREVAEREVAAREAAAKAAREAKAKIMDAKMLEAKAKREATEQAKRSSIRA